jgi:hypothetical protein
MMYFSIKQAIEVLMIVKNSPFSGSELDLVDDEVCLSV